MCGIFAEVSFNGRQLIDRYHRDRVVRALAHRGPDGAGLWESQSEGVSVCLIHTRLKVVDLSDSAAQPMAGVHPDTRIVFNGEIYAFDELRHRLEADGQAFGTRSDTEVLLRALEVGGVEALSGIRGMFAFALWDGGSRSLLLARDRLGIKPLYLSAPGGHLVAASEVRTLVASGVVRPHLCAEALASYFAFGSVSDPLCAVNGVESLEPGNWIRFSDRGIERGRFWRPPRPGTQRVTQREAVLETRRLLNSAVQTHLVADVPVGVFLSSGMDSRAVLESAARCRGSIDAFTVAFPSGGGALDESEPAAAIARRVGARHHVLQLSPDLAASKVPAMLDALDQPSADGPNTFLVSEAVKAAGVVVALSGLGGDELFAGYPHLRHAHLARAFLSANPVRLTQAIARLVPGGTSGRWRKVEALLLAGGDPQKLYSVRRAFFMHPRDDELFTSKLVAGWTRLGLRHLAGTCDIGAGSPAHAQAILELRNYLPNTLLRDADVMSMRHALELRVPLLDAPLVDFVLGLPFAFRVRPWAQKPLLAAAMGIRAPLPTTKQGFTLPFVSWMKGPLRSDFERRMTTLEFSGEWVHAEGAAALWRRFLAGDVRSWSRVWSIFSLDNWIQRMANT